MGEDTSSRDKSDVEQDVDPEVRLDSWLTAIVLLIIAVLFWSGVMHGFTTTYS